MAEPRAGQAAVGQAMRGRPRDPGVRARVLDAALAEYARSGWAGFTMHAVAGRAGVGKSSLYLRWPSKERLLADAIEAYSRPLVLDHDTGSLDGDMRALASHLLAHLLDPVGWVTVRIAVDAAVEAFDLRGFNDRVIVRHSEAARRVIDRAVRRGEVSRDSHSRALLEGLFGGLLMQALTMPAPDERAPADLVEQVTPLVDLLLRGIRAGQAEPVGRPAGPGRSLGGPDDRRKEHHDGVHADRYGTS
ncbi:Transcriptional regulator [Frankia canadensis]|uniref:Transcriptional regulator n=1 Tax=Frankia canadensis TaxID=1836972 RepID=A0A2I2KNV7_9ACTN|nr:TetR/AcrR family transcriptional regulator [Frankia canadensis]SNQ47340.1 Transcriptional regulator [Frankia canadensis]SOU54630.1 Transcriptional regulator [Frankia canadensis]